MRMLHMCPHTNAVPALEARYAEELEEKAFRSAELFLRACVGLQSRHFLVYLYVVGGGV
jgi:hypothetical protein